MRNLYELDTYRLCNPEVISFYGSTGDDTCGVFVVRAMDGQPMQIIASSDMGWDHVSVARRDRAPSYIEMDWIKRLFFKPTETAYQLHVPVEDHINFHEHCLHLWRPQRVDIPLPPKEMVGPV